MNLFVIGSIIFIFFEIGRLTTFGILLFKEWSNSNCDLKSHYLILGVIKLWFKESLPHLNLRNDQIELRVTTSSVDHKIPQSEQTAQYGWFYNPRAQECAVDRKCIDSVVPIKFNCRCECQNVDSDKDSDKDSDRGIRISFFLTINQELLHPVTINQSGTFVTFSLPNVFKFIY